MRLEIPKVPPSLNTYKDLHWSARGKLQRIWDMEVIAGKSRRWKAPSKACVRIIYHFQTVRKRDKDNYTPKLILDALKHCGVIIDDSADVLDVDWGFGETGEERTVITVEEA